MPTKLVVLTASLLAAVPVQAIAQDATPKLNDVFVRSTDGVEVRGQLLDFQPVTLSLFIDGTRREIPLANVDRIQIRGDGVRNGALIGAAIGAGLWGIAAGRYGSEFVPVAVGAAIGYGLVGAGIDAMIPGRTTIYSKPTASANQAGGKRTGLALKVGF